MKIYCSCCDKVQPVVIDECRDAKTDAPFQDIVCAECRLVIASGTDIRLAQPEQEPVAFRTESRITKAVGYWPDRVPDYIDANSWEITPLYTTPPQRKPLLASDIVTMYDENPRSDSEMIAFARAIEAAHGITGEKT